MLYLGATLVEDRTEREKFTGHWYLIMARLKTSGNKNYTWLLPGMMSKQEWICRGRWAILIFCSVVLEC